MCSAGFKYSSSVVLESEGPSFRSVDPYGNLAIPSEHSNTRLGHLVCTRHGEQRIVAAGVFLAVYPSAALLCAYLKLWNGADHPIARQDRPATVTVRCDQRHVCVYEWVTIINKLRNWQGISHDTQQAKPDEQSRTNPPSATGCFFSLLVVTLVTLDFVPNHAPVAADVGHIANHRVRSERMSGAFQGQVGPA